MTLRKEEIYVLYASQTGNSEQAANDFCKEAKMKLSNEYLQSLKKKNKSSSSSGDDDDDNNNSMEYDVVATAMQMDDFLELKHCKYTRILVLITSSYGVGQAPLGGYRFRDLCEEWSDRNNKNDNKDERVLDGLQFAMCGLGDSSYRTFFQNPTVIHDTLLLMGAKRIGELGKADAEGTGDNDQTQVIRRWMDSIWEPLGNAIVGTTILSDERIQQMQQATIQVCIKINPDYVPPPSLSSSSTSYENNNNNNNTSVSSSSFSSSSSYYYTIPLIILLFAILVGYYKMI